MTIAIVGVGETDFAFADPRPASAMALDAIRPAEDSRSGLHRDVGLAGSGTVGAPQLARMAIESGLADVVVFYFTINQSSGPTWFVIASRSSEKLRMPST